jgi:hypothetical protein
MTTAALPVAILLIRNRDYTKDRTDVVDQPAHRPRRAGLLDLSATPEWTGQPITLPATGMHLLINGPAPHRVTPTPPMTVNDHRSIGDQN